MSKLRDRLTNPKDIERYDRNYNSMEVCMTQGELDREYIHIPQNATNGDMINALFPNVETSEFVITIHATTKVECNGVKGGISYDFWKEWWNAPYKAGDTDA